MITEVLKINSEVATELLKNNIDNRLATKRHVRFLSDQMVAGNWKFTGDPIKISSSGRILDGQHRLMAVIQCDMAFDFLVCKDLDDEIFDVLDTGKNRSAGDVLSMKNIANAMGIAALSKMIMRYDGNRTKSGLLSGAGVNSGKSEISNQLILDFAQATDVQPYYQFGARMYAKNKMLSKTEYAFFYCIFSRLDTSDTDIFFDKLVNGVNLQEKDPILYLRNKLIENLSANNKMNVNVRLGLIFKGWNLFRRNSPCTLIRFNITDELPIPI